MSVSEHDRKILWSKAGNRCSYRYKGIICDEELIISEGEKQTLVGEECHIVSKRAGNNRYIADFPNRDSYDNLILMCRKHHKIIDDNQEKYTIDILQSMKKEHEKSIKERLAKKEIQPIIIKDSVFRTEVEHAEEAIGMEVNGPTQFSNVTSELIARDVKSATGFKTNQTLNAIVMTCSKCGRPFPFASTGAPPRIISCPHCGWGNTIP
ncbi:MAG: hypothetical protein E3J67_03510 [Dehalococcoidia bacterium]|nr:MAG: hypothetical protein E3J67_03510 [Dehalococcoidia bacterium]